jgi:hypothetical protein
MSHAPLDVESKDRAAVYLKPPTGGYTIEEMWEVLDALDGTVRAVQPYARRPRCCLCGEPVLKHQSWHNNGSMKHWVCEIRERHELQRRRREGTCANR